MSTIKLEFKGTVAELCMLLNGMHSSVILEARTLDAPAESLEDRAWRECRPDVMAGRKIAAIKLWRTITGAGLRVAKDAIENRGLLAGLYRVNALGHYVLISDESE